MNVPAHSAAARLLAPLPPAARLEAVLRRLAGDGGGPLARLPVATERAPRADALDGRLLEALCEGALDGERGAVFTPAAEARLLAAFGLARAAVARGGPPVAEGVAALLAGRPEPRLAAALDRLSVLDPACGGGALLAAAALLAERVGARLTIHGLDVAPLAARAALARLELLGVPATVRRADAFAARWPAADLVLANPPFLRHEAIRPAEKARAVRASGLSRQADLSAHLVVLALRRAPVAALVLPRALLTARSAAPLVAEAGARGGFALRLRSRAAGSFAASVDTLLTVWAEGGRDLPAAEALVPLAELSDEEAVALAGGRGGRRVELARRGAAPAPREALRLDALCDVRFGVKTGCNAFFHLLPLGGDRYRSALLGEVTLATTDVTPLLASLKEARAPERALATRVLFRTATPSAAALAFIRRGERAGVHRRPTCAGRDPWWLVAPGRGPAPVLYPAKLGARAFAVLNAAGLLEDKKWHALFPRGVEPWALALVLSATPVRLAVDEGARQLTGAQAIADVDCRVLAAAPVPSPAALADVEPELARLREALARDEVTTDLGAMLARPAQEALDHAVGRALGLDRGAVVRSRRLLLERVTARAGHAAAVRSRQAERERVLLEEG